MNIQELLLAGLQQKFPGVDTAILTRIATKKAVGIADEKDVNSVVEGVSFQDVLNSYGDYRAGEASVSAVSNYEKKHGIKDGKPLEIKPKEDKPEEKGSMAELIAKAVSEAVKPLSERIEKYDADKKAEERMIAVVAKAKEYGVPESLAKRYIGDIKEDQDLDAYFKDVKQDLVNAGLKDTTPPDEGKGQVEKDNEAIAKMINDRTKTIIENK